MEGGPGTQREHFMPDSTCAFRSNEPSLTDELKDLHVGGRWDRDEDQIRSILASIRCSILWARS